MAPRLHIQYTRVDSLSPSPMIIYSARALHCSFYCASLFHAQDYFNSPLSSHIPRHANSSFILPASYFREFSSRSRQLPTTLSIHLKQSCPPPATKEVASIPLSPVSIAYLHFGFYHLLLPSQEINISWLFHLIFTCLFSLHLIHWLLSSVIFKSLLTCLSHLQTKPPSSLGTTSSSKSLHFPSICHEKYLCLPCSHIFSLTSVFCFTTTETRLARHLRRSWH